jgi:steroid 5-alpha reductase family enzyme
MIIAVGWAVMAAVMTILWLVQRRRGDAGIVDVAWTIGVGLLAAIFAWQTDGYWARRLLIACLAGLWSLRLALHLAGRLRRLPEDGRYRAMRDERGAGAQRFFFLFFQIQAFWAVLFALPMLLAARNPSPGLGLGDALGTAIWLVAVAGEAVADRQLARFRGDPARRGQVCRDGMWRYSRHPNYFCEWLHWWAYVAIGWGAPWGFLTLLGPATMLLFLFKVTGIPPTEASALRSRGDAYRDYQRTTSAFFPWPPKPPLAESTPP